MWPWGHLAVGYLLYTAVVRLFRTGHERLALVALVVGTQLPDLVDKPLTWVGVLAYGRSLAHSLVVLVPVCALVVVVARRYGRTQAGGAFALGALSHVVGDAWDGLVAGDPGRVSFLFWPFLPSPEGDDGSAAAHASRLVSEVESPRPGTSGVLDAVTAEPVVQGLFLVAVVALWVVEGRPGAG